MKKFLLFVQLFFISFVTINTLSAQELSLSIDIQKSDGTLVFLAPIEGVDDFSECTIKLKFARGLGNLNSGLGQAVYTYTGAHSGNFPFVFEFKSIDIAYRGNVFIKATLDCGDQFVVDSNIIRKNFSKGKKNFKNATQTSNFTRFIREVKRSVDYGV